MTQAFQIIAYVVRQHLSGLIADSVAASLHISRDPCRQLVVVKLTGIEKNGVLLQGFREGAAAVERLVLVANHKYCRGLRLPEILLQHFLSGFLSQISHVLGFPNNDNLAVRHHRKPSRVGKQIGHGNVPSI